MTPETAAAFKQLHHASLAANTLDTKTKELIAVACWRRGLRDEVA